MSELVYLVRDADPTETLNWDSCGCKHEEADSILHIGVLVESSNSHLSVSARHIDRDVCLLLLQHVHLAAEKRRHKRRLRCPVKSHLTILKWTNYYITPIHHLITGLPLFHPFTELYVPASSVNKWNIKALELVMKFHECADVFAQMSGNPSEIDHFVEVIESRWPLGSKLHAILQGCSDQHSLESIYHSRTVGLRS